MSASTDSGIISIKKLKKSDPKHPATLNKKMSLADMRAKLRHSTFMIKRPPFVAENEINKQCELIQQKIIRQFNYSRLFIAPLTLTLI
jgi:hypothetical protein